MLPVQVIMSSDNLMIIDTDPGLDDALAILMALGEESRHLTKLLALTTVRGNVDIDQICRNALRILQVADRLDVCGDMNIILCCQYTFRILISGRVVRCRIARSRVRIPPLAAVYQSQLSVPSLRGRLMSTSESWGVNGHTTRCTSSVFVVLRLRLVSG